MLTKPAAKPKAKKPAARIIKKKPENQTAYVYSTYFGKHNNINISIIQGQNYEENILPFCLTNTQNKEIAEMIVEMIPFERYNFIYYKPILGNLIMNLFDQLQIGSGYAAENEYIDYLQENVKAYKLNNKVIIEEKIREVPKSVYGGVAILQLDTKVNLDNPETFTVNGILLDDLLDELVPIVSLIVLILPKDIEVEIDGMVFPKFSTPVNVGFLVSQEGVKRGEETGLKRFRIDKDTEDIWYQGLTDHIKSILKKLKVKDVDRMFEPQYTEIWKKTFTHQTFDKVNNYESIEFVGDSVLKSCFSVFLFERVPNLDPNILTMMQQNFTSKHYQHKLADDLDIPKFLRIKKKLEDKQREDLLESFTGAILLVSKQVLGLGKAYEIIHRLLELLYEKIEKINFAEVSKSELKLSSMQIKQILEAIKSKYYEKTSNTSSGVQTIITISDQTVDYLRKRGKNIGRVIGTGFAPGQNKDLSSKLAYDDALSTLTKQGITEKWAQEEKERMSKIDPLVADLEEKINIKRKLQKYTHIYHKVDPASCMVYLFGIGQDQNHNLISEINDCDTNRGIRQLYENFISL